MEEPGKKQSICGPTPFPWIGHVDQETLLWKLKDCFSSFEKANSTYTDQQVCSAYMATARIKYKSIYCKAYRHIAIFNNLIAYPPPPPLQCSLPEAEVQWLDVAKHISGREGDIRCRSVCKGALCFPQSQGCFMTLPMARGVLQRGQDKWTYTDSTRNLRRVPYMSFLLAFTFTVNATIDQPCEKGGFCMESFVKRQSVTNVGWALTIWSKPNCLLLSHSEDKMTCLECVWLFYIVLSWSLGQIKGASSGDRKGCERWGVGGVDPVNDPGPTHGLQHSLVRPKSGSVLLFY